MLALMMLRIRFIQEIYLRGIDLLLTIKTLPSEFPGIFAQRMILSLLLFIALCVLSVVLYRSGKYNKSQLTAAIILSAYVVVLLYLTIFGRYSHPEYTYQIHIYKSYKHLFEQFDWQSIRQIIINIAMMIPVGFLLPVLIKNKYKYLLTLISALILILFIESMQLIMQCGTFEVDDVVNNLLGTAIGLMLYKIFSTIYHKSKSQEEK